MRNLNNFKQLLIAKNVAAPSAGVIASPSTIADGVVCVTDEANRVLDSTSVLAVSKIKLVQGQGANRPLIVSPLIPRTAMARARRHNDAVQQVSFIGFDGTSGNIVLPGVGETSIVRNVFKSNFYQYSDKMMESVVGYKQTAADTLASFTSNVAKEIYGDIKAYVYRPFKVERIANGTYAAANTGWTVVKGSNVITKTAHGLTPTAGTAIRVTSSGAPGATSAVYLVKSFTANTIVLDMEYQEVNGAAGQIALATVAPTSWGIRETGLPQTLFIENVWRYEVQKWVPLVQNMGTTPVSTPTQASEGHGTFEQIAEEEVFFQLSEGFADNATIQIPNVTWRKNVELTGTYASLELTWKDVVMNTTNIADTAASFKQVKVAANRTGGVDANTNCVSGLDTNTVDTVLKAFLTGGVAGTYA